MRKAIAFILGIFMVFSLSACGGGSSSNNGGHSYKYKYPTGVDHAIWWEMHENRIKEEPSITEWEGYKHIEVTLDLEDIGYLGLNDYFGLIMADGYVILEAQSNLTNPDDWLGNSIAFPSTTFELMTDPYQTSFGTAYHNVYRIDLDGTYSKATTPYQLTIKYTWNYND